MTRSPQLQGLCADDPDLFFPIGNTGPALVQIEEAKAVCRRCPVMEQCQEWALDTREEFGVWGGLDERQRRAVLRARARGTEVRPRTPLPSFSTCREAYDHMTLTVGDHTEWTGGEVRINGTRRTANQVAWRAIHDGAAPVGRVFPACNHPDCVAHLTDQVTRGASTAQLAA